MGPTLPYIYYSKYTLVQPLRYGKISCLWLQLKFKTLWPCFVVNVSSWSPLWCVVSINTFFIQYYANTWLSICSEHKSDWPFAEVTLSRINKIFIIFLFENDSAVIWFLWDTQIQTKRSWISQMLVQCGHRTHDMWRMVGLAW